jgi:hypothetical protein
MSGNPLREAILKDIVEPAIRASKKTLLGEVVYVDEFSGTLDVRPVSSPMLSSYDDELVTEEFIEKVKFVNSNSIKDAKPVVGDIVYIDFVDNDLSKPVLLNILKHVDSDTFKTGISEMPTSASQFGISNRTNGSVNLGGGGRTSGPLSME